MDAADNDPYFYLSILNITKIENRLVRLSKTSNKYSFDLKFFKFNCSTINQKKYLSEETTPERREMGVVFDCLNDFLLQFGAAIEINYYSLSTAKPPLQVSDGRSFLSSYTRDHRTFKATHTTLVSTRIEQTLKFSF